eukprot:m.71483 g.71483  ORF g.71483 m.71483 type:complete len:93 (+) comp12248_c1_seq2:115-393(+)
MTSQRGRCPLEFCTSMQNLISRNKEIVLPIGERIHSHTFRHVCMTGHLWVAQWLTANFNLTAVDARAYDNRPLIDSEKNRKTMEEGKCYHKY